MVALVLVVEGLVEDLVVALGLVHVLENLAEVAGWVCVVQDLYLEGFVDQEGLDHVPGLQVPLPLVFLMEDLALEGSVLEGFTFGGFL